MSEHSPIRILEEVVIDGGKEKRHRAWPTLELTQAGDLVVAYRSGPDHHITDAGALYVARSQDGGGTWSAGQPIAAEPGWNIYTNHGMTRLGDGTLLLHGIWGRHIGEAKKEFYARARYTKSHDGFLWGEWGRELDFPFLSPTGRGFPYGKIHQLASGRLMVPFYGTPLQATDPGHRVLAVVYSADGGDTWGEFSLLHNDTKGDICPSETDIIRLADGRYLALIRANARRRLYRSYSGDEGNTWSSLEPTAMPGQCPALLRLASGALLCAYRDVSQVGAAADSGVACALSRDEGQSWDPLGYIYRGANADCAYPSMVALPEGRIFLTFYTAAQPAAATGSCEIRGLLLEERAP